MLPRVGVGVSDVDTADMLYIFSSGSIGATRSAQWQTVVVIVKSHGSIARTSDRMSANSMYGSWVRS